MTNTGFEVLPFPKIRRLMEDGGRLGREKHLVHGLFEMDVTEARQAIRASGCPVVNMDSDGYIAELIPLWIEAGINCCNPIEVAAGNDILEIAEHYPDLVMSGGIDKRVLAAGPAAIDEYLLQVIPPLRARGGYIPTCDHGVPSDVSLANYLHYRKRICELDSA